MLKKCNDCYVGEKCLEKRSNTESSFGKYNFSSIGDRYQKCRAVILNHVPIYVIVRFRKSCLLLFCGMS